MRRVLAVACIAVVLVVGFGITSAFGWGNGAHGGAYGTHDWILQRAIDLAGADASWVDTHLALLASDDPDTWRSSYPVNSTEYRLEAARHVYKPDSAYQGAPQAAADHYVLMLDALSANDTATASTELGIVSHYLSDVLSPFHTCSYGVGSLEEGADHPRYESAIDDATDSSGAHRDWIATATPRPVTDMRARTIEAAQFTGNRLLGLIATYGDFSTYDPNTDLTSRMLLSRAANDIADVIRSAKTGSGRPRPIAKIEAWSEYGYPALERPAKVWVRVKDDRGHVVQGVRVDFEFRLPERCTYVEFTDADGTESHVHSRVLGTLGRPFDVVVSARSAGVTLTKTVRLTPTPVIGPSGLHTYTKYDASPAQGTTATVMTDVRDANGAPLAGVKVVHTYRFRGKSVAVSTVTNSAGRAWSSRNIGNAEPGFRVYVRAAAYGGTLPQNKYSGLRKAFSSFVPHGGVASFSAARLTPARPAQSTTVMVRARCRDDHGQPIVGRMVSFSWKLPSRTVLLYARTNGLGYATVSRNIGNSPVGRKVTVTAAVRSGSKVKRSTVSFTPAKP